MAKPKSYLVTLTKKQRRDLQSLTRKGSERAYRIKHAHILLLADENRPQGSSTDEEVCAALSCGIATVQRIRKRFADQGLEAALNRKKQVRPSRPRIVDGSKEAHLIALACSEAPEGHAEWTLRLLADKLVELDVVDSISHECVRQTLKKTKLSPG